MAARSGDAGGSEEPNTSPYTLTFRVDDIEVVPLGLLESEVVDFGEYSRERVPSRRRA
jgi:hypothetical protein